MNITEFAAYAGVSKAAVSRYFNGGYLSEEKRTRIAAAVEATGYHPSLQAQMLRTRRTRQVLVILPKLSSESCARMVEGISDVLDQNGYQLLLVNTANDSSREVAALNLLQQNTVDGVILIATIFTPEHRTVLASLRLPVIILGQEYPGFCSVSHDDRGAAHAATAHMLSKGRTAPGFLGVTMLDKAAGLDRRRGFEDALREAGVPLRPGRTSIAAFNMESGALQYCRSHGIRVPEDLMITAVGDSEAGRVAYVPITSVQLHYRTAGQLAAEMLLEHLADPHTKPENRVLDYVLRPRASTGDTSPEEDIWAE